MRGRSIARDNNVPSKVNNAEFAAVTAFVFASATFDARATKVSSDTCLAVAIFTCRNARAEVTCRRPAAAY